MARTDVHRPTEINPEDYQFVCVQYLWSSNEDPVGEAHFNKEQRDIFNRHREKTSGKFAAVDHGGTCFCCGATARFVARYYHEKSNSYIDLGERCAVKLDDGETSAFRTLRRAMKNARQAIAGKNKAKLILSDLGISSAWDLYESNVYHNTREENIIVEIVARLVRYGELSEKQEELLKKLVHFVNNREVIEAERKAKRDAEKAAAAPCPAGRVTVTGVVVSVKAKESNWGVDVKALIKDETGFTVWGNLPGAFNDLIQWVQVDSFGSDREPRLKVREPKVRFVATITPSRDDTKFGFFKRPSKAEILPAEIREESNTQAA
jgi:hypothetical protein